MTKPAAELAPLDPDLARVVAALPNLPEHIRAAVPALVSTARPADFSMPFDGAFDRLDRQSGGHNFINLVDLRRELATFPRTVFDTGFRQLRMAGRYSLSAAEGRHGISAAEREAGLVEEGTLLLFVSRR